MTYWMPVYSANS